MTTPLETVGMLRNDFAVLVDVREQPEVQEGMADRALWFPASKIEANDPAWREFLGKLPKDKQIVIYGKDPAQGSGIATRLANEGFRAAHFGSFKEWLDAKLPVKKP